MAEHLPANDKTGLEWHRRILSTRRQTPESFNVMVVGRRGVGKSTLLQTICDSFYSLHIESLTEGDRVMYPSASFKDSNVVAEEVLDPFCVFDSLSGTTLIRRCRVRIRELIHSQPVNVEFVDTPGIDSSDEQKAAATINEICGEIERRLQATLDEELRTHRDKSTFASAHIHAVVYMLPPPVYYSSATDSHSHRLEAAADIVTAADLRAIRRLSQYANIIPVVGKCDTIEMSDLALLKNGSFYGEVRDLLVPDRLFDFSDTPNTPYKEPHKEIKAFRRAMLRSMPFLVCGSKHVDEWQQMRLPEYQNSSQSRVSVADWRALVSKHNRVSTSTGIITAGIFRDSRRHNNSNNNNNGAVDPADPNSSAAMVQRLRNLQLQQESILGSTVSSTQSLPMESNTVQIKRLHQRREISLVRSFPWGTLQLNNKDHCDVGIFLDVLFVSFRKSLEYWTNETYYEKYRMQRIAGDYKYANMNSLMTTYLEQEKTLLTVPVSTHQKFSSGSHTRNRNSAGSNSRRYSRQRVQRRLTTGDIASGNGGVVSIVSNAATAGNASSLIFGFSREPDTKSSSGNNAGMNNAAVANTSNEIKGKHNKSSEIAPSNMPNAPVFKFQFPVQHTGHLTSPPDTAITAVAPATEEPSTAHTPTTRPFAGHGGPRSADQPMTSNPHRVSEATTLTTATTSMLKSTSAASSTPPKQRFFDAGSSSVRRGIHMLLSVGGSTKTRQRTKPRPNSSNIDNSSINQRSRRFTIGPVTESALA
ncbi:hypothetical protein GGI11_000927 [Coemansia sp. RSA 2049]|nr:hypothetical protein GGI11_000927 [Coemansia sp. RSA 2049]KAJ2610095.1 hypothetical protein EV177_004138 [Coemansia sp. RSA 1804]